MSMKMIKVIDGICIILFIFMGIYIFALSGGMQDELEPVFTILNPYRIGGWIMGIGFLVTCIWGRGKAGLALGIIMLACYLLTAFIGLFGLIVLTSEWEVLWYLHPVLMIAGMIAAIRNRRRGMSRGK